MKPIKTPFRLVHKPTGSFVGVNGGEMGLHPEAVFAPTFTAENMGPHRADDFHRNFHAEAVKRFGRSVLSRKDVS